MKKQTWQQWARACASDPSSPSKLVKGSLAALTGTDIDVLNAFVPCLELYRRTGHGRLLEATRVMLAEMQPSTLWIARELIPFALTDWSDRERFWPLVAPGGGSLDPQSDALRRRPDQEAR